MRLISLCPSMTKTLCDLGCGPMLVGRTKFCIHPREIRVTVPELGGTKNPNRAQILALEPDLIFLNREENRREDAVFFEEAGLKTYVSYPRSVDDVLFDLASLGELLDKPSEAAVIGARIREARARLFRVSRLKCVRFAYLIWRKPWMAVNGQTYISNLIAEAGGQNVFADEPGDYPVVEPEKLSAFAPDWILLSSEPFPFKQRHLEELAQLTAIPQERFLFVNGEWLSWHGSATEEGLKYLCTLFER